MPNASEADATLTALEVAARRLAKVRAADGRYVARYPGIHRPAADPNFDRKAFVAAVQSATKPATWVPWGTLANLLGITTEQAVSQFEQLSWWGLRRKTGTVSARGACLGGVVVSTPDGAWIVSAIRWEPHA